MAEEYRATFNEKEIEVLKRILASKKKIKLVTEDSSFTDFYSYIGKMFNESLQCPRLEKSQRDLVCILRSMRVYFTAKSMGIESYADDQKKSIENSDVILKLNLEISNMIKSIIMLEEADMRVQSFILLRSLTELSCLLLAVLIDDDLRAICKDDSISPIDKWRKHTTPKALKKIITDYEATTEMYEEIIQALAERRKTIYAKYSDSVHIDYLNVKKHAVDPFNYQNDCMELTDLSNMAEVVMYAMLMQEYIIVIAKGYRITNPGPESLISSVAYHFSKDVGPYYLADNW